MEVRNSLSEFRRKRGMSVAQLASAVGVSRPTIYAIESGNYVPNTSVSLKLARTLTVPVEQLFRLEEELPHLPQAIELLSDGVSVHPGQALRLCEVDGRLIGTTPELGTWGLPQFDAVVVGRSRGSRRGPATVDAQVFERDWTGEHRLLIAGCDPGANIVARELQRKGMELIIVYQNSSRALELLKQGVVHVAGTHLLDEKTGESNLPKIEKKFPRGSVAVIAFALWEEGIVVAPGNPKDIQGVADFARADVQIVNREIGAGCRVLLDSRLRRLGKSGGDIQGYDRIALGHLPAARLVHHGLADCCISTRAAARVFGLDFFPLATKRYDLVVHTKHLKLPQVEALIETLGRGGLRRELEGFAGYDMQLAGNRLM
jgi:molybdopterin molybdotransferase/putative molybdopterin biosynthesis protein